MTDGKEEPTIMFEDEAYSAQDLHHPRIAENWRGPRDLHEEKYKFHNSREASGSFRKRTEYEEKDTTPSKLDSLHYDVKMAIVTRLPAKSLMNFRCVSKMWCSFIRSQELVDSFFAVSSMQPRFIVSFSNNAFGKPEEKLTFLLSYPEGSSSSSLVPRFEKHVIA
uniref:F-box domain-containing protein n=1 Tax=Brassica oleracea var. oleracea TaxID=109376 RepID=A0A0D3D5T3_BRAOL